MRKVLLIFIIFSPFYAFASAELYSFGGSNNYHNIYMTHNLRMFTNRYGKLSVKLKKKEGLYENGLDMLLTFDKGMSDNTGRYNIVADEDCSTRMERQSGRKALFLPRSKSKVLIEYDDESFLGNSDFIGSFTIEFHLKPVGNRSRALIFSKMGPYMEDGSVKMQGVKAELVNGKMVWEFKNFFHNKDGSISIEMDKGSYIESGKFQHHSISYDYYSGRLVKYLNGEPEEITYVSKTGSKNSEMYYPYFHKLNQAAAFIGGGFIGYIDDFKILNKHKDEYALNEYSKFEGELISGVLDLRTQRPRIDFISLDYETPGASDLRLYYRAHTRYFLPDQRSDILDDSHPLKWKYIPNKKFFSNIYGESTLNARYLQVKVAFVPTPELEESPVLNDIKIGYTKNDVPLPPTGLRAVALNGAVALKWHKTSELDVKGYKIYYGKRSGTYDDWTKVPANTNEFVIDGLDNEQIYYITISAYDELGVYHESPFSDELYIRPKVIYTNEYLINQQIGKEWE